MNRGRATPSGFSLTVKAMLTSSESPTPVRIHPRELAVALAPLVLMIAGVYLLAQLLGMTVQLLLLLAASTLMALLVTRLSQKLQEIVGLPQKLGTVLVLLAVTGLMLAVLFLAGSQIVEQFGQLASELPQTLQRWQKAAARYELTKPLAQMADGGLASVNPSMVFGNVSGLFSSVAGFFTAAAFILAVALYLSLDPLTYKRGLLRLIRSRPRRARAEEILSHLGDQLWYFLLGQMTTMGVLAVITTLGLWMLGIPSYLALGLIAGVLAFIPVVGPALAFVPAILVASTQGANAMLYVALLYGGIQFMEGNFLTPLIQRKMSSIPPVLLMVNQAGMGLLFGLFGVALAAPATVVGMVLTEELYLKDADPPLSDRVVAEIDE